MASAVIEGKGYSGGGASQPCLKLSHGLLINR
jgi:hypothetical protein